MKTLVILCFLIAAVKADDLQSLVDFIQVSLLKNLE